MNKKELESWLFQMINPLKVHYTQENAGVIVGYTSTHYENASILMESFTRPLWGLVPFWAGGGKDHEFEAIYRKGIAAGTDKEGKEFWGICRDYDQKFVEMASIAYGILMAPEQLWNPLSEKEKANLEDWLWEINKHECSPSNWQFFCVMVNIALKSVGRKFSRERLECSLKNIDLYYQGHGWYTDGAVGERDYYIGFAFHFYGILYTMYMDDDDPVRCRIYRLRAHEFAQDFVYWFAEDGSAVPYGRSLTYRFAQTAFFSVCAAAGIQVLPLPIMKGIIFRHLRDWMKVPIVDHGGILTIGYKYPNLHISESYNAPGSPYWALKAFAFLKLNEEDEFWDVEEAPLPTMEKLKTLEYGNVVAQRHHGDVVLFVPGRIRPHRFAHTEERYSKFAYSSKFGFSIARSQKSLEEAAPDSMLAFEVGGYIFVKGAIGKHWIRENRVWMEWSPFTGIDVRTEIIPTERGYIRNHEISSIYDCSAYECGFSVSIDNGKSEWEELDDKQSGVHNGDVFCKVELLQGKGAGMILHPDPNTNLIYPKTAIPAIHYEIKKGITKIVSEILY